MLWIARFVAHPIAISKSRRSKDFRKAKINQLFSETQIRQCQARKWTKKYPRLWNKIVITMNLLLQVCSLCSGKIWYFVTKIVLNYREKKLLHWSKKTFEIRGWKPRTFKNFEVTWRIYSNSKRSEQVLVTECFFNLFLEVYQI